MEVKKNNSFQNSTNTLSADLIGGVSGAIAVLPQTIGLSVLLFTTMGMDASAGAMAGLIGAIILLLSSGLMGATTGMISAPNGPVIMLLLGLVGTLAPDYAPNEILITLSAVLFLTGVFQIAFGVMKGGEIIKLIPYPVIASMITAIGILMIISQFNQIAPSGEVDGWYRYIPLIVAVATISAIFLTRKFFPRLPAILIGLLVGVAIYTLLAYSIPSAEKDWVIGTLPAIELAETLQRMEGVDLFQLPWQLVITSALALTVLVMIDCLLTALVADSQTTMRHKANSELVAQGIAHVAIGVAGGLGGGGTKGATLANTMAGGRRWSPIVAALVILSMTLYGREIGNFLPLSALSGVIVYIGLSMINRNIFLWFKDKRTRIDAFNALMVITATMVFDVTTAVALGVVFAIITFIRRGMRRPLIRRESNLIEYPSPRKRNRKHQKILAEHGDKGLLIELQGNLYFARTDQLYRSVMERIEGKRVIILHFRRVLSIDMSGLVILMQLVETARTRGVAIVFTHMHKRLGFGKKVKAAFSLIQREKKSITKVFHSTARSLEYAEELILKSECKDEEYRVLLPVCFEENDLCKGLNQNSISLLKKISIKKKYKSREVVLAEGDESNSLHMVTSGFVEQRLYNGPTSYKVLAKYSPGTYFGEPSFFDLGPISTRFVALGKTVLYKIRRSDIQQESGKVEEKFYASVLYAVGSELSKNSVKLISEIHRLEAL